MSTRSPSPFLSAKWIWLPSTPEKSFYRAVFTRRIDCTGAVRFRFRVTADALYQLWVDGKPMGNGPTRGDGGHYRFETYTTEVLNDSVTITTAVIPPCERLATGEIHIGAGFLLAGEFLDAEDRVITQLATDQNWSSAIDPSFDHNDCDDANWQRTPMAAVGYGEFHDFRKQSHFVSRGPDALLPWEPARELADPYAEHATGKRLEASPLPLPDRSPVALGVWFQPGCTDNETSLPLEIGPEATQWFIDHEELTTGYPRLCFEGGEGRMVRITYAEVLTHGKPEDWLQTENMETAWGARCHRRSEAGLETDVPPMAYYDDMVLAGNGCTFEPGYLRTFRFLKVDFGPGEPLRVLDSGHTFSAHPFRKLARFDCSDSSLRPIPDIAFRTMRLCAHDHFEDCPYFERLQYAGDTGLQAWMSLIVTGDYRLAAQALRQYGWSHAPEDPRMIQTRYPSNSPQTIPVFSLFWMRMAEDWLRFSEDSSPVEDALPRMAETLEWLDELECDGFFPDKGGNFVDWAWGHGLQGFRMPRSPEGYSALVNLQAAWCLASVAETFRRFEKHEDADKALALANRLKDGVRRHCLDAEGRVLDAPHLPDRSQHGQIWAILCDLVDESEQHRLFDALNQDESMVRSSLYHDYFLFRAAEKLNRYPEIWPKVRQWIRLAEKGYTTFPEEDGRHGFIRSECHAWTAWIFGDFLTQILGIRILGPDRVEIRPQPCGLKWAEGAVPFRRGFIEVSWRIENGECKIDALFPEDVQGSVFTPLREKGGPCAPADADPEPS